MNLNELGLFETDDEQIFVARMRHQRNRLLAASDWAMMPDAPTDKTAWAEYRQALRDFPVTWEPGPVADFPNPPGYVKPEVIEPEPTEPEQELPSEPLAEPTTD